MWRVTQAWVGDCRCVLVHTLTLCWHVQFEVRAFLEAWHSALPNKAVEDIATLDLLKVEYTSLDNKAGNALTNTLVCGIPLSGRHSLGALWRRHGCGAVPG